MHTEAHSVSSIWNLQFKVCEYLDIRLPTDLSSMSADRLAYIADLCRCAPICHVFTQTVPTDNGWVGYIFNWLGLGKVKEVTDASKKMSTR